MTEYIITTNNLTVQFPDKVVFKDVNVKVQKGSFLAVVGDNGAGKTTFLKTILGRIKPTSGEINLNPKRDALKIGYVPQFRNLSEDYPLSIENFVALGLTKNILPWLNKTEKNNLAHILKDTNLVERKDARLGVSSGGEKQKAYLAQALIEYPDLLILDESTASLDNVMKYDLLDLVIDYQKKHPVTVIFVTHDLPLAKKYATDYLFLQKATATTGKMTDLDLNELSLSQQTTEINSEKI